MPSIICKYCNQLVQTPRQPYINKNTLTFYYKELRHVNCEKKPIITTDKSSQSICTFL